MFAENDDLGDVKISGNVVLAQDLVDLAADKILLAVVEILSVVPDVNAVVLNEGDVKTEIGVVVENAIEACDVARIAKPGFEIEGTGNQLSTGTCLRAVEAYAVDPGPSRDTSPSMCSSWSGYDIENHQSRLLK